MSKTIEEAMKSASDSFGKQKPLPEPTREQLENNIKAFHNFRTAVMSGTFAGAQAVHITNLLMLLDAEHDENVRKYQEALKAHPEWEAVKQ